MSHRRSFSPSRSLLGSYCVKATKDVEVIVVLVCIISILCRTVQDSRCIEEMKV